MNLPIVCSIIGQTGEDVVSSTTGPLSPVYVDEHRVF